MVVVFINQLSSLKYREVKDELASTMSINVSSNVMNNLQKKIEF